MGRSRDASVPLLREGSGLHGEVPPPPQATEPRRRRRRLRLGLASQVPEVRRRPFICAYYRLEPPALRHFWCSHNELGNLWTHIIAFAISGWRFVSWLLNVEIPPWGLLTMYQAGICLFLVGSLVMFYVSVEYHWRSCDTDAAYLRWLCLDQSMCLALVIIGFFAGVPMGFHCYPRLQCLYCCLSVLTCLAMAVAVSALPKERWELIAAVIILGTGIGYVTPAIHWLYICERGWQVAGPKFVVQLLVTFIAVVLYVKFIPECFAPGRFDLWGHSHQWWHCAIFLSILLYSEVCIDVYALVASGNFCA